jgi:hypothetical protein
LECLAENDLRGFCGESGEEVVIEREFEYGRELVVDLGVLSAALQDRSGIGQSAFLAGG